MIPSELLDFLKRKPAYSVLLEIAETDPVLVASIVEFAKSEEFTETINLVGKYSPYAKNILEIGASNELSGINLAFHGYNVMVVSPVTLLFSNSFALIETLPLDGTVKLIHDFTSSVSVFAESYDIIYVRQRMHQAEDLGRFIEHCVKQLKPDGVIISMRDDIVIDGGQSSPKNTQTLLGKDVSLINNFSSDQYKEAMLAAGLHVLEEMKYFQLPNASGFRFSDWEERSDKRGKISGFKSFSYFLVIQFGRLFNKIRSAFTRKSKKPSKVFSYVLGRQIQSVLLLVGVKTVNIIKNLVYHD